MALNLSVKQKLVLSLWGTTFLLVSLTGSLASLWFVQDQSRRLDDFLSREVRGVQDTLQAYFSVNNGEGPEVDSVTTLGFRAFLNAYLQDRLNRPLPYKTTLGVFGPQGNLIQSSNFALSLVTDLPIPANDLVLTTVEGPPEYRMVVIGLNNDGRTLGTVRLACLTTTLSEVSNSFLLSFFLVLALIFLSFGALGSLFIVWSLKPVREMSLSAQDISDSHLDLRLTAPPGKDEISEMARTLNRLLERLERDFQWEEALVGQLSHELRTPLAILRGRNEVALDRLPRSMDSLKPLLEDNLADIDNIVSLLNTLLSLARLDGRIDPLRMVSCDLGALLRDLIEELEPMWEAKDLSFHLSLPGRVSAWSQASALGVRADPVLLRQVFLNLFTNAYKYTPKGSRIHLSIEGGGTPEAPTWSIVVRNPGPPIPEESLELVFKRFYRVEVQDPDRYERNSGLGQKGFGLGLSIAKTLADLHGGSIRAFNPETGGAAFEVCLPRETRDPSPTNPRSMP